MPDVAPQFVFFLTEGHVNVFFFNDKKRSWIKLKPNWINNFSTIWNWIDFESAQLDLIPFFLISSSSTSFPSASSSTSFSSSPPPLLPSPSSPPPPLRYLILLLRLIPFSYSSSIFSSSSTFTSISFPFCTSYAFSSTTTSTRWRVPFFYGSGFPSSAAISSLPQWRWVPFLDGASSLSNDEFPSSALPNSPPDFLAR